MSRRARAQQRPATRSAQARLLTRLAIATGQTTAEVTEHIRRAIELGWLIETADGWQAALPADIAPPDWTGPVT